MNSWIRSHKHLLAAVSGICTVGLNPKVYISVVVHIHVACYAVGCLLNV